MTASTGAVPSSMRTRYNISTIFILVFHFLFSFFSQSILFSSSYFSSSSPFSFFIIPFLTLLPLSPQPPLLPANLPPPSLPLLRSLPPSPPLPPYFSSSRIRVSPATFREECMARLTSLRTKSCVANDFQIMHEWGRGTTMLFVKMALECNIRWE